MYYAKEGKIYVKICAIPMGSAWKESASVIQIILVHNVNA